MSRNYVFAPEEYYHLYARGFEKMPVYRSEGDYKRFLEGLYLCNSERPVDIRTAKHSQLPHKSLTFEEVFGLECGEMLASIGAYCLMPNHFHILVRARSDMGISKFMQKLLTSYTMYFNKQHDRTGAIFGSSFKARHVQDDNHLKYLFAYIHLNPKEITGAGKLKQYPYSSYPDYIGIERAQANILDREAFPDYFSGAMEKEVREWLSISADKINKG